MRFQKVDSFPARGLEGRSYRCRSLRISIADSLSAEPAYRHGYTQPLRRLRLTAPRKLESTQGSSSPRLSLVLRIAFLTPGDLSFADVIPHFRGSLEPC